MVNANGVAEVDRVQDLEERMLGHGVIVKIQTFFRYAGEKITLRAELKNNESTVVGSHDLHHRDHIRMMTGLMM